MLTNTGSTGTWSQISPTTPLAIFDDINSATPTLTGLVASTVYTFRYTATNLCGSTVANVNITTNATQGPSAAVAGSNVCVAVGTSVINLSAVAPLTGTGTWSKLVAGNPGVITTPTNATTTVTGITPNNVYGYIYTTSLAGCASSTDTVFMANTGASLSVANAGIDKEVCAAAGVNTVALSAVASINGLGTWTQESGPVGVLFSNANDPSCVVTLPINGKYEFRWTISNGACPSTTDVVRVIFYNKPSLAVATTSDATLCGASNGVIAINAIAPTTVIYSWIALTNNPVIIANSTSASTTATVLSGTTLLRWTVASPSSVCPSSFDDVLVKYIPTANAGKDTAFCKATSIILKGSNAGAGVGTWTLVSGPNTPTLTKQGDDSTYSASPMLTGTYVYRWTVTAVGCATTFDDVNIAIDAVTNPAAGVDLCSITNKAITLTGNTIPVGTTATWSVYSQPSGSSAGTFSAANASVTNYTNPNAAGVYNFQYQFKKGACTILDYVQVNVTTQSVAKPDIKLCNNGSFTMAANVADVAAAETGMWSFYNKFPAASPAVITNTVLNTTTVTSLNAGDSVNLIWTITPAGGCAAIKDTVAVVNRAIITASVSAAATYCDNLSGLNLNGNSPLPGTGAWVLVSKPAGAPNPVWSNQNTRNANVKGLTIGSYTFQYKITNAPCAASTNNVVISSSCTILPVTLRGFSIIEKNCTAVLSWISETEINLNKYEVEYSTNATAYNKIGELLGKGSNNSYSFTNKILIDGKGYYRLKVVDIDGKYSYSDIIVSNVKCGGKLISVFPNPANNILDINVEGYSTKLKMSFIDMSGRLIMQNQLSNGINKIDCSKISSGTYTITCKDENGNVENRKVTIAH